MSAWTPGAAALDLVCPRCRADVGEGCQTASGQPAETHMGRYQPLLRAYSAGYDEAVAWQQEVRATRGGVR